LEGHVYPIFRQTNEASHSHISICVMEEIGCILYTIVHYCTLLYTIVHYCTLLYLIFSIKAISKKRNCQSFTQPLMLAMVRWSWDDSHAPGLEPSMGHRRFLVRQRRWFSQWFHRQKWWAKRWA
jgi:hypothetical protein